MLSRNTALDDGVNSLPMYDVVQRQNGTKSRYKVKKWTI